MSSRPTRTLEDLVEQMAADRDARGRLELLLEQLTPTQLERGAQLYLASAGAARIVAVALQHRKADLLAEGLKRVIASASLLEQWSREMEQADPGPH